MSKELSNECELLERISAGDETAFIKIFRFYQPLIFQVAFHLVKSQTLAEELLQDVFIKVWQKRETLPQIDDFKSWLFIISRNHILNQMKRIAKDRQVRDTWINEQPLHENSTDYKLRANYFNKMLNNIIELLPTQQRAVFKLAKEEYLTYSQIAEKLSISPNTVRIHMSRALTSIRKSLKDHGIEYLLLFMMSYHTLSNLDTYFN